MTTGEEAEVDGEAVIEGEVVGGEDRTPGHTPVVGAEDISPMATRYHPIGGRDRAKPKARNPKVDRDATTVVALGTLGESVLIMNVGTVAGEDAISVYVLGPESITLAGRRACTANPGIHCGHAGRTKPARCTSANGGEDGRTGEEDTTI